MEKIKPSALGGIHEGEEQFRILAETANDAIVLADSRGRIAYLNKATEYIFGYGHDDLIEQSLAFLLAGRFRLDFEKILGAGNVHLVGPKERILELTGQKRDGAEFPVELSLSSWKSSAGLCFAAIIRDATQRKRAEEELRRLNQELLAGREELEKRVAERTQELQKTNEELQRSNAELERFAYVASHDLQEPLRTVAGYVQLLGRRYQDKLDQDAKDFIAFAVDGAARMKNLINGLLEYSRIGRKDMPLQRTNAQVVVEQAIANLHIALKETGASLTYDPLPTVMSDPVLLTEVFQNLIGNAIKFCGDHPPKIHIEAQNKEGLWTFHIQDHGIGIDPKHAARIFEIFQRLHPSDKYPGTGLGLAICKKIIERHGGRIWVDSQRGQGASFYFILRGD
jgi:PAS domain S-box-containing protein